MSSTEAPLLVPAMELAQHGVAIFPVRVQVVDGRKQVVPIKSWRQASTTDMATIGQWFRPGGAWEYASLAIDCGKSGLVVVDPDGTEGIGNWRALVEEHRLPATWRAATPGGGEHWYYRANRHRLISIDSSGKVAEHVDVRGVGGFVIAPPSSDARGRYRWLEGEPDWAALPTVPDLVADRMDGKPKAEAPAADSPFVGPARVFTPEQAEQFWRPALDALRTAPDGTINHRLNDAAVVLGHFVPVFLGREQAKAMLMDALSHTVYDGKTWRAERTIASGLDAPGWKAERAAAPAAGAPVPIAPGSALTPEEIEAHELAQAIAVELRRQRARQAAQRTLRAEQTAALPPPEFVPLSALLAEPDEPVLYRVDELWPRHGRVMLVAQAKAGKTTLRDNLARALADGDRFLGRFGVEPIPAGRTLIILDVELSRGNLRRWLAVQNITNTDRIVVVPLRGAVASFEIFTDEGRAAWAQRIRQWRGAAIVLDCLGPVLAAFGMDEKENSAVGSFLVAFEALLKEAEIDEALVVHHMGHANERGRGASRLRDWPDAEWRLVKDEDDPESDSEPARYFAAKGRDVELPETQLRFDLDTHRLATTTIGTRQDAKAAKGVEPVLAFIAGNPGLSQNKIEQGLSGSVGRNEVRKAIALGRARNMIHVHSTNSGNQHFLPESCPRCATAPPAPLARQAHPTDHCAGAPIGGAAQSGAGIQDQKLNHSTGAAQFVAPAPVGCPCGREHHAPGDMDRCPACGKLYHRYGAGALRNCPHCSGSGQ